MSVIALKNIGKRFHKMESVFSRKDLFWALKDVSLEVMPGETVGIIGPNGSGKTTLMRVIAGITRPTTGQARIDGRVSPLIAMGACMNQELTGPDNAEIAMALHGLSRNETKKLLPEIMAFAGLSDFPDMPLKKYSSGMFSRLNFSVASHLPMDIFLVDEALSFGDQKFQERSLNKVRALRKEGKTIVFISHWLEEVEKIAERAIWMEKGVLMADGAAAEVISRYRASAA